MKPEIEQAKTHLLKAVLPLVQLHHQEVILLFSPQEYHFWNQALQLPEVKQAIAITGIPWKLRPVFPDGRQLPDIIIATHEDATNGNLARYLEAGEPNGLL